MLRVFPNTAKATVTHTSIHGFTCRADVSNISHVLVEADSFRSPAKDLGLPAYMHVHSGWNMQGKIE